MRINETFMKLLFFFLLLKLWCSISLPLAATVMLEYCENYLKSCLSFHIVHSVLKNQSKSLIFTKLQAKYSQIDIKIN